MDLECVSLLRRKEKYVMKVSKKEKLGTVPNFSIPNYSIPNYSVPNFSIPNYSIPNFSIPNYSVPNFLNLLK